MDGEPLPQTLLFLFSEAASEVKLHDRVSVLSHYDADGISAAGILCAALLRANKKVHVTLVKSLEDETIKEVASGSKCLIVSDMGSSNLPALEALSAKVIVLDHHKPVGDSQKVMHVNPHLFGIDGMTSACAGSLAQLFAVAMDERNWDLLPTAFAGITGDRQHIRGLSGLNAYLLENGVKRGIVEVRQGSLLPSGKLVDELADCVDPYLIGVTGDREGAASLLGEAKVPPEARLEDLTENQKRMLSSLVALRLLKQGCTISAMEELITDRYYFKSVNRYAEDLAQLLNACGRTDQEGVGVSLVLGDEAAMKKAELLRRQYKDAIVVAMRALIEKGVNRMSNIQWFESTNTSLSGVLAGLTMQFVGDCDKPTITIAFHQDKVRVSSRASFRILEKGVDLAAALREAAQAVGGVGGGHAVAAGATVPKGRENEFLQKLDAIVGEQKAKKSPAT
ncbi:MAG TPA: DHH family phosphoesterase [Methanomassiliicoccales archaeon]|nr:DHH family phosphoesterase [Methanomassiliicoccales archaeon]